jgi:hypothetical protein
MDPTTASNTAANAKLINLNPVAPNAPNTTPSIPEPIVF